MVTMKQQVRKFDDNFHLLGRLPIPHTNPLNTVEGNAEDTCVVKQYPVIYDGIVGYGSPLLIQITIYDKVLPTEVKQN